ncbi:hypothetical protein SAMN02745176_03428 [Lutispora thermophila DSM 19022]|uniref:Uncharacterized protein n=1 Tax=Lutispora thermophila DSM 19022 TaxID=1122184 RepID=A0A1M6IX55_9FIRM|nr:hypothetical protein SAMN02745176_03428 [Lutispora thermophila DSM 19022]
MLCLIVRNAITEEDSTFDKMFIRLLCWEFILGISNGVIKLEIV